MGNRLACNGFDILARTEILDGAVNLFIGSTDDACLIDFHTVERRLMQKEFLNGQLLRNHAIWIVNMFAIQFGANSCFFDIATQNRLVTNHPNHFVNNVGFLNLREGADKAERHKGRKQ